MRAVLTGLGVAALAAATALAQTPPVFEAADVHVNPPTMSPNQGVRPGAIRNGVYEIGNATMLDLIRIAYRVEADKVLGGPSWLEVDKYNVFAKVPAGLDFETARPLLATLLADHPIERPLLALVLANPIDLARVALLLRFDIAALMGYTGAIFERFFGGSMGLAVATAALVLWAALPAWAGMRAFQRKDF